MDDKAIIAKINELLSQSGLSREKAALAMGISRTTLYSVISGSTKNVYQYIPAFAKLFGVSEVSLVFPDLDLQTLLRESDNWQEQRTQLIQEYEDRISQLKKENEEKDKKLREKNEHIAVLSKLCSMQERLLEQK